MRRKSQDSKQLKLVLSESSEIQHLSEENCRLQAENERLRVQNTALMEEWC